MCSCNRLYLVAERAEHETKKGPRNRKGEGRGGRGLPVSGVAAPPFGCAETGSKSWHACRLLPVLDSAFATSYFNLRRARIRGHRDKSSNGRAWNCAFHDRVFRHKGEFKWLAVSPARDSAVQVITTSAPEIVCIR